MTTIPSLAIIGTAGRDAESMNCVTPTSFQKMVDVANDYKAEKIKHNQNFAIVSGGAAVSDHVALYLFDKCEESARLVLHLPCEWDFVKHCFVDNGKDGSTNNPGRRANQLHKHFSKRAGINSLDELHAKLVSWRALGPEASKIDVEVHSGFHSRNRAIAQNANFLLALGFQDSMTPGTAMTFSACGGDRKYVKICC